MSDSIASQTSSGNSHEAHSRPDGAFMGILPEARLWMPQVY
jgi:hypothetical protein